MSAMRFKSSNSDTWVQPQLHQDTSMRRMIHGPIRPMLEEPGLLRKFFKLL